MVAFRARTLTAISAPTTGQKKPDRMRCEWATPCGWPSRASTAFPRANWRAAAIRGRPALVCEEGMLRRPYQQNAIGDRQPPPVPARMVQRSTPLTVEEANPGASPSLSAHRGDMVAAVETEAHERLDQMAQGRPALEQLYDRHAQLVYNLAL